MATNPYDRLGAQAELPTWVDMGDNNQSSQSISPLMDVLKMKIGAARGPKGEGHAGGDIGPAGHEAGGGGPQSL